MPASIFSETELARLASFPEEIPGDDLIRAFTLTGADRDLVAIRRGAANRLGLALQLCALRYLGFVPRNLSAAPRSAACFVADQLFEALASSRPSSWARLSALSKGSTRVVYVLFCARPRAELTSRTIRSGAGKTSLSVRNRSRARRKRTFGASCSRARSTSQASSSSKSRDRSIEKPRCSRTSVKCCRRVCSRRA